MLGHPKYRIGDKVRFTNLQETKVGIIEIVDANGSWAAPNDVSYDILVQEPTGPCLYKHVTERYVSPLLCEATEDLRCLEAEVRRWYTR